MDRSAKILAAIQRDMQILELGPSYEPLAPKCDGWNTTTVDHASREELVEKYQGMPNVDVSRIEGVDVLWTEGTLDAAVPPELHGSFDACIASQVLEHIPDPIGLMESLERLLTQDGVVYLAIPDKRFCFDFFKPLSSVGELLEAHERRAVRHSLKTRFDMDAYSVRSGGEDAWGRKVMDDVTFFLTLDQAKQGLDVMRTSEDGPYVDSHAWHFTPSSFALAIVELAVLDELGFHVDRSYPTETFEFYVTLRRGREALAPDKLEARRVELLQATLLEVREQTDFLPAVAARRQRLRDAVAAARRRVQARTRLRAAVAAARRRADKH